MAGNNLQLTFAVARCDECKAENKLYEILRILQWRCADNMVSALAYDKETEQILVDKDALMRAIQYANPGQAYRDIRLVTHEEYRARRDNWKSDCTCDSEKIRHNGKTIYIDKPFLY